MRTNTYTKVRDLYSTIANLAGQHSYLDDTGCGYLKLNESLTKTNNQMIILFVNDEQLCLEGWDMHVSTQGDRFT